MTPNHGTPIQEALVYLRDTTRLTKPECAEILATLPTAYRTYGDLPWVLERGELAKDLIARLKKVLEK